VFDLELEGKLHEECGVFGIFRNNGDSVVPETYHALYALQHRGQESCGIAVNRNRVLSCYKDMGLVNEVFTRDVMQKMPEGSIAVGHCRYGTSGVNSRDNAQPLLINHFKGQMALCHNGSLTNAAQLRQDLESSGAIFHTTTDSEVIAYMITGARLRTPSIEAAVLAAMEQLEGAYSLVLMSPNKLIAARDPYGFRPLCMGDLNGDTVFASESCALDAIGARFVRDIRPGEVVKVTRQGIESYQYAHSRKSAMCVFEFIYFARPDSVIEGASVHEARLRAGAYLALDHPVDADIVIGVPDSGLDAALGFSRQSGIPYGVGFIKNRYIGRTFIQPTQQERTDQVRIKLNVLKHTVQGKRVVLVDDSIVRGTTAARIVILLREAGAAQVHMRLSSPPFIKPCYFGTDIDSDEALIAHHHTVEEIRDIIGVDSLGYLSIEACDKLAAGAACGFCKGCFTGQYPAPIPAGDRNGHYGRILIDMPEAVNA
jgi:amidophosphoribosyltransferase